MSIKKQLFEHCRQLIAGRITDLQQSIQAFQEAANEDSKSSMGDKYETSRAMMHLEKEKASTQLNQLLKMKQVLDGIRVDKETERVDLGSLVTTKNGKYFLSIGLGPIKLSDEDYFIISAASPIGQILMGKKKGDTIVFRDKEVKILAVE